jgi:hypothetical protein
LSTAATTPAGAAGRAPDNDIADGCARGPTDPSARRSNLRSTNAQSAARVPSPPRRTHNGPAANREDNVPFGIAHVEDVSDRRPTISTGRRSAAAAICADP